MIMFLWSSNTDKAKLGEWNSDCVRGKQGAGKGIR